MIGIAIQYAVLSVMAVKQKMHTFNQQVDENLLPLNKISMDSITKELFRQKAFLESRYQTSKTDSISLSVNLKDSILQLEIKGVILKSTKIAKFKVDQFLYQLKPASYQSLFGTKSKVKKDLSTIRKEPVQVKKAPKSANEVIEPSVSVDSLQTELVHWMIELDNDIIIKIEGMDQFSSSDWWAEQNFWLLQNRIQYQKLKKTIRCQVPEYHPEILLEISEADAKAIYRALPKHSYVNVRL
jgi:hypothetical protein